MLSPEVYERARLSRDARFDGRFFVGVKTTGIYCRPICPAVAPKRENVTFYPSAAAASEAGYRPCLRCRPECAPGTPAWHGTSTTVRRGLRLIADGALDDGSIEQLAERLGITGRHLRRLFAEHLGASPLAIAHTQRLHFAKRLIDESDMPLRQVATAAGYGSVRRFNDAFRNTYGRSPRELRRRSDNQSRTDGTLTVKLQWREPFDWASLLRFLAGRATPGVEQVIGGAYFRTVVIDGQPAVIECRADDSDRALQLTLHGVGTLSLLPLVQRVREMFDLEAPVDDIRSLLGRDKRLRQLLRHHPGVRVPGAWDGFELAIRAILGQQISVKAATTLAGRIAARYGEAVQMPDSLAGVDELQLERLFPTPAKLSRVRFNAMGIVGSRIATMRRLAAATVAGDVEFDAGQDVERFCDALTALPGIGDWTAQYVAMRGLKHPDGFPAADLGLLKAAAAGKTLRPQELLQRAEAWRPWRAYAAMLLWGSLENSGG